MKIGALHRLLAALLVGLFCLPTFAQSGDAGAEAKINDAINNHYLMMKLDKAESVLSEAISSCGDDCSPAIKARAWMYIGLVRGSGKNDQAGAADAFAQAKAIDPGVVLDSELATSETQQTFDGTQGGTSSGPPPGPALPASESAAPPPSGVPGDMICSPQGSAIQTSVPIPISCTSDANVAAGFIKFQEPGSDDWKKITLMEIDGQWQAEIPCKFTAREGELKFYIGVKDPSGEYVDQFGSNKMPATIFLEEDGSVPAFPGQPPVERCGSVASGSADCPPDFPGCSSSEDTRECGNLDWGASCGNSTQCKCGLLCEEGQCATAPTCTSDADCGENSCIDGYCSAVTSGSEDGSSPFSRHWFSLGVGLDLMPLGGNDLCNGSFSESYGIQCYNAQNEYTTVDNVNIEQGVAIGQIRIKLGYDYALFDKLLLGARVGFAFMNTHPSAIGVQSFLPIHIEGRATYSFTSLTNAGLRPSLYLAGGMAEADAKLVAPSTDPDTGGATETQIYKVTGYGFFAPGGSLGYMFAPNMGVSADVQLMLLFPAGGVAVAIHPGLSFTYGL